ncbi:DUF1178 family protein [Siculibacillus lacustris]|uniref:DUF1178 family protein n=1 Tax=Siculibacillus lacustris TaxID=1549641 RepID=A0A4V6MZ52_9HYPH|nr:DUF1178 family protein [Siculibacillus lacustris]TBW40435.1 DUF1178 family protein [Siculibacillus lacustris]
MIHYSLLCDSDHAFEGWFRSSEDFDAQAAKGLISCPVCGSTVVNRAMMAPSVRTARGREEREEAPRRQAVMMPDPAQKMMLEALREIRKKVTENATYVGDRFAEEARRMHFGEVEHQGIYGEATADEVHALAEDGVEFQPLPTLPEERN